MRHEPRICEDDGWPAHCTDDVTFHNTQGHAITISQNPSSQWPFDPPAGDPRYHIRAHGTRRLQNCFWSFNRSPQLFR